MFQLCLYLSKGRLCNVFLGERKKGEERGQKRQAGWGNLSFCYCKRSAKENNNVWEKNNTACTPWFKAGMGVDDGLFI